ncbi:hypothetical protein IGI04_004716, partial [Brassica rapa subsp. trilocularis]
CIYLKGTIVILYGFGLRESEKVFNCVGGSVQASHGTAKAVMMRSAYVMLTRQPKTPLCVCTFVWATMWTRLVVMRGGQKLRKPLVLK